MKTKKLSPFLLYLLFTAFIYPAFAQQELALPVDPQLRYGKLPNGLTYYIRRNEQPAERADFYIAQRVGSILEEDSQSGLAHFLEHLAFHGTRHFPGKKLRDYLETIGVRYVDDLNAYTNFDETVYLIRNVPTVRESIVDSCLLILHDWSGAISLEDEAIDRERGVIHEEWRNRNDAQTRMMEQKIRLLLPGSRYVDRMPIGKMDVVDNFPPDTLRNYYKKWYRPDLQAVIVVGDIDAGRVEAELKRIFSDIPAPVDPAERVLYPVPDNDRPLVAIVTDKEAPYTLFSILYKHDVMPQELRATRAGFVRDYLLLIASGLIDNRLDKLVYAEDSPFLYVNSYHGKYFGAKTKNLWEMASTLKEGEFGKAVRALVKEIRRIKQFGFTPAEYERVKTNLLQSYESLYKERDKQLNDLFVQQYVDHFTDGGYIPGIEAEYALLRETASRTSLEEVNRFVAGLLADDNIALLLSGPEKKGLAYPAPDELLGMYDEAQRLEVAPYQDEFSDDLSASDLPAPGRIVSVEENTALGATELLLSNGVRVILKKTAFKDDEILMKASRPGGTSLFDASDKVNYLLMIDAIRGNSPGNYSALDLREYLSGKHDLRKKPGGKQAELTLEIGFDSEKLNGSATPDDLETLFQLTYRAFTASCGNRATYRLFVTRLKDKLQNLEADPFTAFVDRMWQVVYDNNPRKTSIKVPDLEKADYDRMLELYGERFGDATDFLFTFVGNIDIDTIRPYIEQYLATLPARKGPQRANDKNFVPYRKGRIVNHFRHPMETPKALVVDIYSGATAGTPADLIAADLLEQILDIVYMEKVREEQSGTYGVSVTAEICKFPAAARQILLETFFITDPGRFESLNRIVHAELARIAGKGPRETDFRKAQENMLKKQAERVGENSYWLSVLDDYYFYGLDRYSRYNELLQAMTPRKIKTFAKKLISQKNRVEVVMLPEEKPAAAHE